MHCIVRMMMMTHATDRIPADHAITHHAMHAGVSRGAATRSRCAALCRIMYPYTPGSNLLINET
eukprot:SAG31_NODE_28357_length_411_cov_0.942308_1_plen_63_part_01